MLTRQKFLKKAGIAALIQAFLKTFNEVIIDLSTYFKAKKLIMEVKLPVKPLILSD